MRASRLLRFAAVASLLLCALACTPKDPLADFPDPPPAPKGFASTDEAMAAAMAGKVEVLLPPFDVPETVKETKDVEYGKVGDRALLLDLYQPASATKPVPALVFIHGGGWEQGDKSEYKYYNVRFAEKGYVTATISYRFSKEALFPGAVQDAKCAIRFLRANAAKYNIDPDKIGVMGGSAGGYLAMMLGYAVDVPEFEGDGGHAGASSRVQAVINGYGPCDLTWDEAKKAASVKNFLGKTFDEAPDLYAKASPTTYITKDAPPTLILHGTVDEIVPVAQSDALEAKLKELGVPVVYARLEGFPHTMDVAKAVNEHCCFYLDNFLERVLPLPK